jgi:hypothetical protein
MAVTPVAAAEGDRHASGLPRTRQEILLDAQSHNPAPDAARRPHSGRAGGRRAAGGPLTCPVCRLPVTDWETAVHPACLAERLPQDAAVALAALLVAVLAPAVVVWAG